MQQPMAKLGSRTVTGLALMLSALALDLASELLLGSISLFAANTFLVGPMQPYTFHTIFLPGLSLSLLGAVALLGLAGVTFTERGRDRFSDPRSRLDRVRLALLVAVLAEVAVLVSGLVLGFAYLGDRRIALGIIIGAPIAVAVAVGLYLLWTAERVDPGSAWPYGWIGLVPGGASSASWAGCSMYLRMSEFTAFNPMSAIGIVLILGLTAFVLGLLSLVAWIVVYYRMLVKLRPASAPSPAASRA